MIFDEKLEALLSEILEQEISCHKTGTNVNFEVNEEVFDRIVEHLQTNELITSIFDNKMMCAGNGYSKIQLKSLAEWLIYNSEKTGVKETIDQFNDYLELEYTPGIAILAVSGIEINEKIQLSDKIELIPFIDLPPSKSKNALCPSFMQENPGLGRINPIFSGYNPPKAALVKKVHFHPKSYDNSKKEPDIITIDYKDLYEACDFLTLLSNTTIVPVGSWLEVDKKVPCHQMLGIGFSYSNPEVFSNIDIPFNIYEWNKIKSTYSHFTKLDQKTKNLLRITLKRLNQARRRQRIEDKVIDQGIAYEVLFLNDKAHMEQLSFMLRLRASLLLGENIEDRRELIDFFKAFYTCRSKSTHEGKLNKEIKVANKGKMEVKELLEKSDKLCIEAIKKIILNGGFPNWEELMLGVGLDKLNDVNQSEEKQHKN